MAKGNRKRANKTAQPAQQRADEHSAKRTGLRLVGAGDFTIQRRRLGKKFVYVSADGRMIRKRMLIARLNRLAVPPAYVEARYCSDARGHIQAIWRDAAGRLQYRYHNDWEAIRSTRRRRRLAALVHVLPRVRREVERQLRRHSVSIEFALAAVIELVAVSGIRAGRESYARINGTRGAATLLKSNISVRRAEVTLSFKAKGGKTMRKTVHAPHLAAAVRRLMHVPGKRLFQYRDDTGAVRAVHARQVNEFLRSLAGAYLSLKDFRTLTASEVALEILARRPPADSERRRKKQVVEAMQRASTELGNTPAICRRSYVPARLVGAFECGKLQEAARGRRSKAALLYTLLADES